MAQNTKIEWTATVKPDGTIIPGHTCNLWWGCTNVSPGCDACYAEAWSKRWGNNIWGNDRPRKIIASAFKDLDAMQKEAEKSGEIHRVFVGSMMDIFEKPMPLIDSKGIPSDYEFLNTGILRNRLFSKIMMKKYENLLFLFLTKRPSNINKYIPEHWKQHPPKNVMFGTSVVNQETAETLIPQIMQVNGQLFLSMEPLIDRVDLSKIPGVADKICQIIVGGESGIKRRPFNCDWAREIRDYCKQSGVSFFMKQIDKILPIPDDLNIREYPQLLMS